MTGIGGIVSVAGGPAAEAVPGPFCAQLARRGGCEPRWTHLTGASLASASVSPDPAAQDGPVYVVADARLDGREDLIRRLGGAARNDFTDAELILHAFLRWGERCVDHLLGDFAFAIWHASQCRLFCARDPFGIKQFLWAERSGHLIFSNSIRAMRACPGVSTSLDDAVVGDFLLFGLSKDLAATFFRGIHRLAPGHCLRWSGTSLTTHRYWNFAVPDRRASRPREVIEEFTETLAAAVRDRMRGNRVALLLSGGLDSSSIAAVASDSGAARPTAYTIVYRALIPDRELDYASLVADAFGLPLRTFARDSYGLFERIDEDPIHTPEPLNEPTRAAHIDLLREIARDCDVALWGHGADEALRWTPASLGEALRRERVGRLCRGWLQYLLWRRRRPPLGVRTWLRSQFAPPSREQAPPPLPRWINPHFVERNGLRDRWHEHHQGRPSRGHPRSAAQDVLAGHLLPVLLKDYDFDFAGVRLDCRMPFLDARLLRLLLSLSAVPWCVDKTLLRVALPLPAAIGNRPKTPLAEDPVAILGPRFSGRFTEILASAPDLSYYFDPAALIESLECPGLSWTDLAPVSFAAWMACERKRNPSSRN